MTPDREFYAETVEDAVEKASQKLGVPDQELEYEVLDPGSSGFLGIGGRDARIEVSEKNLHERHKTPDPDADDDGAISEPDEEEIQEPAEGFLEENGSQTHEVEHDPAPDELLGEVRNFVASAVDMMGLEAKIDVYDAGEFVAVDVSSTEAGLFIGQKGETIDALQYLLNVATYKDKTFVKKAIIDSEGYRQRRIEAVQGIAHRMARKTIREQRPTELPPMNSSERRIVHMFLKDNPKVETDSQGNGDNRRVVVSPHQ